MIIKFQNMFKRFFVRDIFENSKKQQQYFDSNAIYQKSGCIPYNYYEIFVNFASID